MKLLQECTLMQERKQGTIIFPEKLIYEPKIYFFKVLARMGLISVTQVMPIINTIHEREIAYYSIKFANKTPRF